MNEQNAIQSLAQPAISVIVPVYQVERFLPACIDSLLAQTFADFELILVDDGSPDNCPALCDAAAQRDDRVRVLHKPNGGVSTARNAGLDMARGKWTAFVDSDDSVQPDYLEKMYTAALAAGADIALCGGQCVDEEGRVIGPGEPRITDEVMDREEALRRLVTPEYQVPWNKLYRRILLTGNDIQFTSELKWAEDLVFNMQYIQYAETFVSIDKAGYYYVQNPQSICHTQINPTSIVQNKIQTFRYYKDLYTRLGMYEEVRPQLYKFLVDIAESTYPSGPFKKIIEEAKEYWKNRKE